LPAGGKVPPHDIVCINRKFDVIAKRPDFATKPHPDSAPQYSDNYVEWIVSELKNTPSFLASARQFYSEKQKVKRVAAAKRTKALVGSRSGTVVPKRRRRVRSYPLIILSRRTRSP
jgi:hypothetical protein